MFKRFTLGFYRAYAEPQTLDFAIPDDGCIGLNVIVGQNNSGKSTALTVMKELFHQSQDFIHDSMSRVGDHAPIVKLDVHFDQGDESVFCEERTAGFFVKIIEGKDAAQSENRRNQLRSRVQFLPSRRSWSDRFNRAAKQSKQQMEDQLFNLQRNQEAQLGLILSTIIRDGQKPEFDKILIRVMPDVVDWGVNRFLDQDYIEYKSPSGNVHALSLLGEGFSSVFRMTYTLFSSKPGDVVILDEPELSLHPEAQKSLYKLLSELAEDRQIIIATHSPYMVNWEHLSRGARLFRVGIGTDGSATVTSLSDAAIKDVMPAVEGDIRNRKNFDVLAKEVFFRSRVVFCEGQEDVLFIENYLRAENREPLPLFGYGSGGDRWIAKWLVLATDLGIRAAAIYDGNVVDEAERVAELFKSNPDVKTWIIPANDIRDKCRGEALEHGIFNTKGEINAEFRPAFNAMLDDVEKWLKA
ncbi:ATP-dependent nuclease [Roseovarius sp. S1116L3]|uniref:ATP-dependent nuclease n=1 Tax=Roseovarius roseus TaxID=3342636 RepID=UPI00372C65C5